MTVVVEHVGETVAHLARRAQHLGVIAVGEDPAAGAQLAVQGPGQPDAQPLHAPGEGPLVLGLDEEVHVRVLHRVMDYLHPQLGVHLPEARADDPVQRLLPQPWETRL